MNFEGDSYQLSFQTLNTTWQRGFSDPNTKQYSDALNHYYSELSSEIIDPSLKNQKLHFELTGFSKGPGNVLIIHANLVVKQSNSNNIITAKDVLRSRTIEYFNEEKVPKTL